MFLLDYAVYWNFFLSLFLKELVLFVLLLEKWNEVFRYYQILKFEFRLSQFWIRCKFRRFWRCSNVSVIFHYIFKFNKSIDRLLHTILIFNLLLIFNCWFFIFKFLHSIHEIFLALSIYLLKKVIFRLCFLIFLIHCSFNMQRIDVWSNLFFLNFKVLHFAGLILSIYKSLTERIVIFL